MSRNQARPAERLVERLAGPAPLVVPGAADALSARIIADLGFEAVYVTGAGLSNSHLGVPDLGLVTLTELADSVEAIADAVDLPLIVDGDTGFGGPLNVARTVRLLGRRGAAAIQLEDQVFPKRCGHFAGKQVVPAEEMVARIRAAVDARGGDGPAIIARTDARDVLGLDSAISRAQLYRDAGADITFVESPHSREELAEIGRRLPGPLVANMVEGGLTPVLPADELGALGFSLILYANAALRGAINGMTRVLRALREQGSTLGVLTELASWQERQRIVGKPAFDELEARYAVDGTGNHGV